MEGAQPYLGDLLAMVINHLLNGMILQVYTILQWIRIQEKKNVASSYRVKLVGGFNPFEKYSSNWTISPGRGEYKNIFEITT